MIYYVGMKIELNGYKESFLSIIIMYLCLVFLFIETGILGHTHNETTITKTKKHDSTAYTNYYECL